MIRNILITIALLVVVTAAFSEEAASPPAPVVLEDSSSDQPLQATVVSVAGKVSKMTFDAEGQEQWSPLTVGETLDEMTVIRTGFRSSVVLRMEDRGEVTIDRVSKVGIREFRRQNDGLTRTRLGMKYGNMNYKVDSSRGANDARVTTPVATLSVRGSQAQIGYTGDRGLGLRSQAGTWRTAAGRRTRDVTPGERTTDQLELSVDLVMEDRTELTTGLTSAEQRALYENIPAIFPGGSSMDIPNPSESSQTAPRPPSPPDGHITPGI
jgi:hypothetical protein